MNCHGAVQLRKFPHHLKTEGRFAVVGCAIYDLDSCLFRVSKSVLPLSGKRHGVVPFLLDILY